MQLYRWLQGVDYGSLDEPFTGAIRREVCNDAGSGWGEAKTTTRAFCRESNQGAVKRTLHFHAKDKIERLLGDQLCFLY